LFWLALLAFGWIASLAGCNGDNAPTAVESPGNLLQGLRPTKAEGVRRPDVLTDGIMARTTDPWNTELTAVFHHESSFVEYDLGSVKPFKAAYLQADNNDTYVVSAS
jgi:hypothetical protein